MPLRILLCLLIIFCSIILPNRARKSTITTKIVKTSIKPPKKAQNVDVITETESETTAIETTTVRTTTTETTTTETISVETATTFMENISRIQILREFSMWKRNFSQNFDQKIKPKTIAIQDFWTNRQNILRHNSRQNETYKRKLQVYSDFSYEEIKIHRMGIKTDEITKLKPIPFPYIPKKEKKPSVNYTKYFPPVKDQGLCGACWAFTSVALLEYISRKNDGNDFYSEQCLIDCDESGWPTNALEYIIENGISDGREYKYEAKNGTCQKDIYPPIFTINNVCTYFLEGSEEKLRQLVDIGPVIVCIGTTDGFTSYSSGVFSDKSCPVNKIDHAVVVVGYGSYSPVMDYWIIRNSWGPEWGYNGYGLIARNKGNQCGIATWAITVC